MLHGMLIEPIPMSMPRQRTTNEQEDFYKLQEEGKIPSSEEYMTFAHFRKQNVTKLEAYHSWIEYLQSCSWDKLIREIEWRESIRYKEAFLQWSEAHPHLRMEHEQHIRYVWDDVTINIVKYSIRCERARWKKQIEENPHYYDFMKG
jgi:hypothetical protein